MPTTADRSSTTAYNAAEKRAIAGRKGRQLPTCPRELFFARPLMGARVARIECLSWRGRLLDYGHGLPCCSFRLALTMHAIHLCLCDHPASTIYSKHNFISYQLGLPDDAGSPTSANRLAWKRTRWTCRLSSMHPKLHLSTLPYIITHVAVTTLICMKKAAQCD